MYASPKSTPCRASSACNAGYFSSPVPSHSQDRDWYSLSYLVCHCLKVGRDNCLLFFVGGPPLAVLGHFSAMLASSTQSLASYKLSTAICRLVANWLQCEFSPQSMHFLIVWCAVYIHFAAESAWQPTCKAQLATLLHPNLKLHHTGLLQLPGHA